MSWRTALRWVGEGAMRSRVVAKTMAKATAAMAPYSAIVSCQPSASSPRPSQPTRSSVSQLTRMVPPKAAMKRKLTRVVRCWLSAVITPERAEYGIDITV